MPHTACPRSAAVRTPIPASGHCRPMPPLETLKHSKTGLTQSPWGLWVPVCTKFCLSPPSISGGYGVCLNAILSLLPSCWVFSFALGHGVSFFGGIQHSPVSGYSAMSCNFGILSGEDGHTSFYSVILSLNVCVYLHI